MPGRPFSAIRTITDQEIAALRAAAVRLGELHGVAAPKTVAAGSGAWTYGDTAHEQFGKPVEAAAIGDPTRLITRGTMALVCSVSLATGVWTKANFVVQSSGESWLSAKREGAGRDKRPSKIQPQPNGLRPLFREAAQVLAQPRRS